MKSAGIMLIVCGCMAFFLVLPLAISGNLPAIFCEIIFVFTIGRGIVRIREARKQKEANERQQREVDKGRNVVQNVDKALIDFAEDNCVIKIDKPST